MSTGEIQSPDFSKHLAGTGYQVNMNGTYPGSCAFSPLPAAEYVKDVF